MPKPLTLDFIHAADNNCLLKAVWDITFKLADSGGGSMAQCADRLHQPWRMIYTTFLLDAEVCNGGFHQFFWNSEGQLNDATEADLEIIGASDHLTLFRRGVRLFTEFDIAGKKHRSENTWEEFAEGYETIPWGDLDDAYFGLSPKLFDLVAAHIRAHGVEFTNID